MKRKNFLSLFLGVGALAIALGMNYSYAAKDYGIKTNTLSKSVLANGSDSDGESGGESGSGGTSAAPFCYNGGIGAVSCSIEGGIEIAGSGVSASCMVSCSSGYYACCSLRCTCVSNP
jgi:hypothetical protein